MRHTGRHWNSRRFAATMKALRLMVETMTTPDQRTGQRSGALRRFLPLAAVLAGLAVGYAMGLHHYLSLDFLARSREMLTSYVAANYAMSLAGFFVAGLAGSVSVGGAVASAIASASRRPISTHSS